MTTAYLDIDNNVIGVSSVFRPLEIAQDVNPSIVTVVENAPDNVVVKGKRGAVLYHKLTAGNGTDISHYTEVTDLDDYKNNRIQEIKMNTQTLESLGFLYDERTFSMDTTFAFVYSSLLLLDEKKAITYPFPIQCLNSTTYYVTDRSSLRELVASTAAAILELQESESQLKLDILAASTKEEIDGIVDNRTQLGSPNTQIVSIADFTAKGSYEAEDQQQTSTTSKVPRVRLVLTANEVQENSVWDLDWSFEYRSSTSNATAYSSVEADGSEIARDHTDGEEWTSSVGKKKLTLTEGSHTFNISYWSSSKKYAATIRRLHIKLTRRNEV